MTFVWAYGLGAGLCVLALSLLTHYTHLHGQRHPRPHFQVLRWLHAHLILATLAAALSGVLAGFFVVAYTVIKGPHGFITPPVPAQTPPRGSQHSGPKRGRGLLPPPRRIRPPHLFGAGTQQYTDLSAYLPPVRAQGAVNSCVSWAITYALRGYYAYRARAYPPGGYAPYYTYSQLTGGANTGTSLDATFTLIAQQGADNSADYYQQAAGDYWSQPTPAQRRHAAPWHSLGYQTLWAGAGQGILVEQAVRQSLANGDPVVVGIPIYDNIYRANKSSYYITGISGGYYGLHATVAAKSDANGVWLFGSWGLDYGLNGWIEVSYEFLDRMAVQGAIMIMPRPAPSAPTPTPRPTPNPLAGRLFVLLHDQRIRPLPAAWPVGARTLHQGSILRATGQQHGAWLRLFVPGGRSWVLRNNVRGVR